MWAVTNKAQIEKRFGGDKVNLDEFWPIILKENNIEPFFVSEEAEKKLVSLDDYKQ